MRVEYSLRKDAKNRREHGISLERAEDFDFDTAIEMDDTSQDYGEERVIAMGFSTLLFMFSCTRKSKK